MGMSQVSARCLAISALSASVAKLVVKIKVVLLSSCCQKDGRCGDLLYKVSLEVTINVLSIRMNIFLSCSTAK